MVQILHACVSKPFFFTNSLLTIRLQCNQATKPSLSITKPITIINTAIVVATLLKHLSQSHSQGTALRKMFPPFTSYFQWQSDQGQSSCTVVMRRPTKPQSQSCAGFTNSYKTNTNTTMIAKTWLSLLSLSCCQGIQLWGRCSLLWHFAFDDRVIRARVHIPW